MIRTSFEQARAYQREWQRYESLSKRQQARTAPPRRDLRLEPLVEILEGKRDIHVAQLPRRRNPHADAPRRGARFSRRPPSSTCWKATGVADEMAAHGASGSTFSDWWSFKMEAFDAIPYNAAIMTRAGCADQSQFGQFRPRAAPQPGGGQDASLRRPDREQALAMVTINPAKQLKIDEPRRLAGRRQGRRRRHLERRSAERLQPGRHDLCRRQAALQSGGWMWLTAPG